jgi:hypothetical protein
MLAMAKVKERKPLKGPGSSLITDSNFDPVLFTESEAKKFAKNALKRSRIHGCKKVGLRDCGEYWRYSIC